MGFTIQDFDLRKTFEFEKKQLLFAGFYPRSNDKNRLLYVLGSVINLFFSFGQISTMGIQMVLDRHNLSRLSETMQYFITTATFVFKLANFIFYKKNLLAIEEVLTLPNFYGFSDDKLKLLKQKISSCKRVIKTYRILVVLAVTLYLITPYLDDGKYEKLPVPAWFPYNVTEYHAPTFTFQVLGVLNTAHTNSAIDILTWMLISVVSGQFEILKDNLKNIDYTDPNLEKTKENFKQCVKHHEEIVKLAYKIEETFSGGVFLQFFASVIIICFTGFLMIIVPLFTMQFAFLVMYFLTMMCQVAMYCWYGHDVMTTSYKIGEFFYASNWYESDLLIRKSVTIFLERTKKPVTLTAGGFVTLSLTTLTGILKSSYSYFAVLRHIYSDS